jgi:sigma-B regulation protein RsbU (phosphoserine phosphatase)
MTHVPTPSRPLATAITDHQVTVLLIDDQPIIGEAVRRMLAGEPDIVYHYCSDPTRALEMAGQISPTVILQDLVMPEIDGLTLVKYFRANATTRTIPLIVLSTKEEPTTKAEAFALGANDYLVKLPDKIEVLARIRYHSKGYIAELQRNEAYAALRRTQESLARELAEAARYVVSLLPQPLDGEVQAMWEFIPSSSLGGDSFGYHWIDDEHFMIYLLDVCGHGVGAALLSISVMNVLRARSLPNTDFRQPSAVLKSLNDTFPMEKQNDMYFTMWYGVYNKTRHQLAFSSGGHPPALLISGDSPQDAEVRELRADNFMIGAFSDVDYDTETVDLQAFNKLYIFSDGSYEIIQPDGQLWQYQEFVDLVAKPPTPGVSDVTRILAGCRAINGSDNFQDDFSLLQLVFRRPPPTVSE